MSAFSFPSWLRKQTIGSGPCLAHAGELLGVARDPVVGDAAEDGALQALAWEGGGEALGCAGVLPVLNEGGHGGFGLVWFG